MSIVFVIFTLLHKKTIHDGYHTLTDFKIRWPMLGSYVEILKMNTYN